MVESGDLIAAGKIFAEIGEVVSDKKPGVAKMTTRSHSSNRLARRLKI